MYRIFLAFALVLGLSACGSKGTDYSKTPLSYFVFFETNSVDLTQEGYALVQRAAEGVRRVKPQSIVIAGYSDKVGSEAANKKLSEHRTAIVQKTLIDLGVDARIITTLPLGEATDALGPTADRRIEIRLLKDESKPAPKS